MTDLKGKTLFITGATRGIGYAIAERAAKDGAILQSLPRRLNRNQHYQGLFLLLLRI